MMIYLLSFLVVWLFLCVALSYYLVIHNEAKGVYLGRAYIALFFWPIWVPVGFALGGILAAPFFALVLYYKWKARQALKQI